MKFGLIGGLVTLAVAAPLAALAQDDPTRILSDPAYLPLAGQIYGHTDYAFDNLNGDTARAAGTAHEHLWGDLFGQYLAYGLTSRLSFDASLDYLTRHEHDTTVAGSVTGEGRQGFENPTFGVTWRALDQASRAPLDLDLRGYWAPDAFSAKTAIAGSDGTVAAGAPRAGFGLAASHVGRQFTVQAGVTANYVGDGEVFDRAASADIHSQSYWDPSLRLATQTRLGPRVSVNVGGDYDFSYSHDVVDDGDGLMRRVHQGPAGDLKVAVNYHFVPNRLVGSVGYTHNFLGHANTTFPTDPALDSLFTRSSDTVGVSLGYVFR